MSETLELLENYKSQFQEGVEIWYNYVGIERRNAMSNLSLASTLTANMSKGGPFIKIYLTHKQSP
jgi:hypothetical protein